MTSRTGMVVLLMGLPAMAGADAGVDMAQCAEVASRFGSNPQGLKIGELDLLKTCINVQVMAMATDAEQHLRSQPPRRSLATVQPLDEL